MINKIKELLLTKPNPVIAIDGSCASGKTTLAKSLAGQFGMQVIHMDEFFLLPAMRTEERLSTAGGNIHYERFIDEVVSGIKSGKEFSYRIFSCKKGDFDGTNIINPRKPIIIEGAYALHPEIPDIYDCEQYAYTALVFALRCFEKYEDNDLDELAFTILSIFISISK